MGNTPGLDQTLVFGGLVAVQNQLSSEPATNAIACVLELALRRQWQWINGHNRESYGLRIPQPVP
jgi:hypothetical protein